MVPNMSSASEPRLKSPKQSGSSSASHAANAASGEPKLRTAADQAIIDRALAKRNAIKRMPRWNLQANGDGYTLVSAMEDRELAEAMSLEALGLTTIEELRNILETLVKLSSAGGDASQQRFTSLLASVCSIGPRDPIEAMLAVHMAIVNDAIAGQSMALDNAKNTMQVDAANNALNKLTRTFNEQLSALKKHRSGGPQRIIFEKVEVNNGGQAVVGYVGRDGQGNSGIAVNETVEMTPPSQRSTPAGRLTAARREERLEMPFTDRLGPAIAKVAVEKKVPVAVTPAEHIALPTSPRPPKSSRVHLGRYASWQRQRK
jgi:hypothetical protein